MPLRLGLLVLTLSVGVGCASDEAERRKEAPAARHAEDRDPRHADREARHSHVQQAIDSEDESSQEMTIRGEEGTLNAADVESALNEHFDEIRDCCHLGRRGPRGVGGRVTLRFFVDGKGEVDEVSVVESSLRNRAIEHCLADVGVGVVFQPPAGHRRTTFDYPVEFRSDREVIAGRQRRP